MLTMIPDWKWSRHPQVYLAQALDRLRFHSLTSKSSSSRLKFNGDDTVKRSGPAGQGRNMLTTVEKFRQMRPRPHYPTIAPLQGTPLLEQIPVRKKQTTDTSAYLGADTRPHREMIQQTPRSAHSKVTISIQTIHDLYLTYYLLLIYNTKQTSIFLNITRQWTRPQNRYVRFCVKVKYLFKVMV